MRKRGLQRAGILAKKSVADKFFQAEVVFLYESGECRTMIFGKYRHTRVLI